MSKHSQATTDESKSLNSKNQGVQGEMKQKSQVKTQTEHALLQYFKEHHNISLFVCIFGVIGFYSYYSYLQEFLLADKAKKLNVNVVMGFQNIIALVISTMILKASYNQSLADCLTPGDFLVGFLVFGSMYCSNFALKFVGYPFVVLSKSAKIMPVIIMGSIRKVYTLHPIQYLLAFLISLGLILFNSNKLQNLEADNLVGIFLVLASLFFDGLTASQTDKQHKTSGRDYAYSIMFSNNFVQIIFNIAFFIPQFFFQEDTTIQRVFADPILLRDVIMIGASGALGQIFIYFTISLYNSYLLTVITTTRKMFSVVFSNFQFHHHFSNVQWIGAAIVMGCTFSELLIGRKNKASSHAQSPEKKKD